MKHINGLTRRRVEVSGTHCRVGATMLGALGACLFGPVGLVVLGALGYCEGVKISRAIADKQLPDDEVDDIGQVCVNKGDRTVRVILEKDGCNSLSPLGRGIFGDRVRKTIIYEADENRSCGDEKLW